MQAIFWTTTIIISSFLLWSSYSYIFSEATIKGVGDLGFPDHFRVMLAILKLIAVVVLIIPQVPLPVKEWAYAGVGLFFITAIIAHFSNKDPLVINLINIVLLCILIVSRYALYKLMA